MTIKKRVLEALKTLDAPVYFGGWTPEGNEQPPPIYVTFTTMSRPAGHEDDARSQWRHYVYLTIWSSGAYQETREALFDQMELAGFENAELREGWKEATATNECNMTWVYLEEM